MSSDAAGRLLGMATIRPSAARVIADLLDSGCGLDLDERTGAEPEVGRPAREAAGAVIAVHRGGRLLAADDPQAARLEAGDRLILLATAAQR